jgi:hypothetical protein
MRITGAYCIIETLAEKKNINFSQALQYVAENYKSCDKYQKIAYDTLANPAVKALV